MLYLQKRFIRLYLIPLSLFLQESLPDDDCGRVFRSPETAVNGQETKDAPWTVSIGYHDGQGDYNHICSGSILSKTVIITAAHCAREFEMEDYEIHAGKKNPRLMGVVERPIAETTVIVHPNYKDPQQYFDVALIILNEPFEFAPNIQPICLPTTAENSSEEIKNWGLRVQGWSPNYVEDQNNLLLTEINVNVGSNEECNHIYSTRVSPHIKNVWLPELLLPSQFCAGTLSRGRTAPGDSGGPAILKQWNNGPQFKLVGVVSGGFKNVDGYYVFVAHTDVLSWIKENMKQTHRVRSDLIHPPTSILSSNKPVAEILTSTSKPIDPCTPNPCGPSSKCSSLGPSAVCTCLPGFYGRSPNCNSKCLKDNECPSDTVCLIGKCKNPCKEVCDIKDGLLADLQNLQGQSCEVINNVPECKCNNWYKEDPRYPEFLTVSSEGPAAVLHDHRLGVYKRICNHRTNNRPVWKMRGGESYVFAESNNKGFNWVVGPDYNSDRGGIISYRGGQPLLGSKWKYWNSVVDGNDAYWAHDNKLNIRGGQPNYSEQVTISSSGEAAKVQPVRMGVYKRVPYLFELGRPVYRQVNGDQYISSSSNGRWIVNGDYTSDEAGIESKEEGALDVLYQTWMYYDGKSWVEESSLRVE